MDRRNDRSRRLTATVMSIEEARAWKDPGLGDIATRSVRRTPGDDKGYYEDAYLEDLVVSDYYAVTVDSLNEHLPRRRTGRPREMEMSSMALFMFGVGARFNMRELHGNMSEERWSRLRTLSMDRWGPKSPRVLPKQIPGRTSIQNWISKIVATDWYTSSIATFRWKALEDAIKAGLFADGVGSWSNLNPNQAVQSDATWIRSPYGYGNGAVILDGKTGELRIRRHDESAYTHTDRDGTGRSLVFTSARLPYTRERWILGFTDLRRGEDTGNKEQEIPAFVEHVRWLKHELGDNLKVAIYDMALSARYQRELFRIRVIPVVKVPRVNGKKAKVGKLDKRVTFHLPDKTTKMLDVFTDDGWPVIIVMVDGSEHYVQLQKTRRNHNGPSLGFFYSIPEHPAVPRALRGATCRFGMNPFKSSESLFTHFRAVPEASDEFSELFGGREDTESIHADLKRRLANKRARSWTRTGQLMDILAFAVFTNIRANSANLARTQDPPVDIAA